MLENLIKLVQEHAGDAIINNPDVPNERNNEAIEATAGSIFDSLQNKVAGAGGLETVTNIFQGNQSGHDLMAGGLGSDVIGGLVKKLGLSEGAAAGIVAKLLPTVLDQFKSKTNDPDDKDFDLQDIIGSLTGGKSGGIVNTIKGLFGM